MTTMPRRQGGLGEFSHVGLLFTFGQFFWKITEVTQMLVIFFPMAKVMYYF
jgi:hypothetical protein